MTIKEMCELSNIEYNSKNPKRSLEHLRKIYEIEQIDKRHYNIIRNLTEDEQIAINKITKCKELLKDLIYVQLSLNENNSIRKDMKGFLELFNIINNNYRYFSYDNLTENKIKILNDYLDCGKNISNYDLCAFVEDVNPILYRMVNEVFNNMENEMLIHRKKYLMFTKKIRYETEKGIVEFTNTYEADNNQIEQYMNLYRQFAYDMGYTDIENFKVKYFDGKIIKSKVCKTLGIDWAYYEYEIILNKNWIGKIVDNNNNLKQLKNSLNKNVIHKLNNSTQGDLKNYNNELKMDCIDVLIKNPQ